MSTGVASIEATLNITLAQVGFSMAAGGTVAARAVGSL